MVPGELLEDPVTSVTTNAAVLFSAEWPRGCVVYAVIVDMSHTGFNGQSKLHTEIPVLVNTALERPNSVSVATRRASASS